MKKKGFTLLEIVLSITGFFLLMTVVINAYLGVIKFRYSFQARANLIENTYYMFERINILLRDYTIDYEEYFNRSVVGCNLIGSDFSWDVGLSGYCSNFTSYGNYNSFATDTSYHKLYYCSSTTGYNINDELVVLNPLIETGCSFGGLQSFGQYALNFFDVKSDSDGSNSAIGDSDDTDLGMGPEAILQSTGVQELYLISQDKQHRVFLRRKLVEQGDWDENGVISGDSESLYTLQILKLKGFDAGESHDFMGYGVYDGTIDTWACDYSQGFICNGNSIGSVYSGYRLPLDFDDGWVNLFDRSLTITEWNITIYPTKDPNLSWMEQAYQINPYFIISMKTKLYGGVWQKRLNESIHDFQFTLQTTFDTKNYY